MPVVDLSTPSSWMRMYTQIILDEMKQYLVTLESQFENLAKDFDQRVEREAETIEDEEERDRFYEWHSDDYWRYKETFPRFFLNSLFVSIYSILETQLDSIAKRLKIHKKQLFHLSEIKRGDYLESSRKYILRLTTIDIHRIDSWRKLKEYQQIRNIIVHENGKPEKPSNTNLAKTLGIYDESNKVISISESYAEGFLSVLHKFFDDLYAELSAGERM